MLAAMNVSRRAFSRLIASGTVLAALPSGAASARAHPRAAVVGFHGDAPWLDPSGRDRPFVPPIGAGAFVADRESLMRLGHFL